MRDKDELKELFEQYIKGSNGLEPCDSNHWLRRLYRCYIDGSYKGSEHYQSNIEQVKEALQLTAGRKSIRLRMLARSKFREFLEIEFPDVKGMGAIIGKMLSEAQNKLLTAELVDDLLDLARE